ncbi:conserved protein of unknown function [Tenacibaculum soleae]|uniref:GLPGLI family protein n=1 Tax=Tenacibaculum soleae TaxID=447689 RepID=UPI0023001F9B|nr:GLPGLI family protein [Tenacibaculum soleae]
MLKTRVVLILFIAVSIQIIAQSKKGSIVYKAELNKKYIDSFLVELNKEKDTPMSIKQEVVRMYRNSKPDEFILSFKNEESYYQHIPKLEEEGGYNIGSSAGTTPYYTNNKTKSIIQMSEYLGYIAHKPLDWKITNKTKNIGKYKCYQAIALERLYSRRGFYYTKRIIAWFTPSIPLNFGPKYYKGLPGLILEINRDKFNISAIKINFNPTKELKIKRPPKKAKIKTEKEAHGIIKDLEKERKKRD